jgi:hypothetical protein
MRTAVIPTTSTHHGRAIGIVEHDITAVEAAQVAEVLAGQGIRVKPVIDVFHTLHLWPVGDITTREETRALRAFVAVTDGPVAFHRPKLPAAQRVSGGAA